MNQAVTGSRKAAFLFLRVHEGPIAKVASIGPSRASNRLTFGLSGLCIRLCGNRKDHLDDLGLDRPLVLGKRLGIQPQRDSEVGKTERFLTHLDVRATGKQEAGI
jgi:hypothetical protein